MKMIKVYVVLSSGVGFDAVFPAEDWDTMYEWLETNDSVDHYVVDI